MKNFVACLQIAAVVLCLSIIPAYAARVLHGNPTSYIYHNSSCRYYNCKNCYVVFNSRKEAHEAGYRACKVCGG